MVRRSRDRDQLGTATGSDDMTDMTGTCQLENMKDAHVHPDVRITVLQCHCGHDMPVKTTQDASAGKDGREAP